jgi:uncharacterized membrane protein HdeD (DUF308 family)
VLNIPADQAQAISPISLDPVRRARGWFFGLGIVFVLLGVLAILLPFAASLATTLLLGWLLVIGGVVQGFHAIQNRAWGGSGWALLGALIHVVAGALVIEFPVTGTLALTLVLAVFLAAQGILKIIRAMQHREMPAWGWLVFDGVLSLVLGLMIALGWPSTAVWAIGLLLGIDLLFGGSSMLVLAFATRPAKLAAP